MVLVVPVGDGRFCVLFVRRIDMDVNFEATYVIVGTYRGNDEVIDEAETRREAEYLQKEYQLAYGPAWTVRIKRLEEEAA